jgi:hypothetical protein
VRPVAGLAHANNLDLADIAYDASTTFQYTPNGSSTGGTLNVSDGTRTANISLVGQYSQLSFVASSDGHGGTTIVDPPS